MLFVASLHSCLWSVIANDEDGDGATGGDDVSYVIDIVDSFGLKEIELKKAAWGAYVKCKSHSFIVAAEYLPKIKAHLESTGKADRVQAFMKGATAMCKDI